MKYVEKSTLGSTNCGIVFFNRYAVGVFGFLCCFTVLVFHYITYVRPLILDPTLGLPEVAGAFELVAAASEHAG